MFFAIVIAKHLFGGLGHNVLNPAMVGYVVVLLSFPQATTPAAPLDSIRASIAIAYAAGGFWLMWRRVITWHVPAAMIGSVLLLGFAGFLLDPGSNPAPLQQVFSGTIILGAFFIATDPVSGCTSQRGRLVFGAGVGIVTLIIRRWGAYPDGVAFAVLVMNMAAPLIDRYTQPRFYGR
jgi:electron transport complex protein RnfD